MKSTKCSRVAVMVVAMLSLAPLTAKAETFLETYDGATCIPYPPFDRTNAVPYQHWLYGFRQSAFCHFPTPNGWRVGELSYVLFAGSSPDAFTPVRVRLCVATHSFSTTCGTEATIAGFPTANWVALPSPMPSVPVSTFLSVLFPVGGASTLNHFTPVWSR